MGNASSIDVEIRYSCLSMVHMLEQQGGIQLDDQARCIHP